MIRGFWLALPILLVVALDGLFTLLGQNATWWLGAGGPREANPVGMWFLAYGPKAFALAMAAWGGLILLVSSSLPGILGRLLRVLLVVLGGLTTLHVPGHSGGGSRDDCGAGCHA